MLEDDIADFLQRVCTLGELRLRSIENQVGRKLELAG